MEANITKEVLAYIYATLNDDQGVSVAAIDALHDLRYVVTHRIPSSSLGPEIGKLLEACRVTDRRYYIPAGL